MPLSNLSKHEVQDDTRRIGKPHVQSSHPQHFSTEQEETRRCSQGSHHVPLRSHPHCFDPFQIIAEVIEGLPERVEICVNRLSLAASPSLSSYSATGFIVRRAGFTTPLVDLATAGSAAVALRPRFPRPMAFASADRLAL